MVQLNIPVPSAAPKPVEEAIKPAVEQPSLAATSPVRDSGDRRDKPYDFRRPDKLSKEHLRTLQTLHESFARLARSTLGSYLRTAVQTQVLFVDQVLYDEYIEQLPNPTAVHVLELDPLPGRALLVFDMPLALSMIDRVLGGAGKPLNRVREITEIELALLRSLVDSLLAPYREAWSSIDAVRPILEDIVLNPQLIQTALPGGAAILIRLEVRISNQPYAVDICLPYSTLEPLAGKLSNRVWFGSDHRSDPIESENHQRILQVGVPVVAVLGRTQLSFRELLALEVGHIILLDAPTRHPLEITVEHQPYFQGIPGLSGRHLAVQISAIAPEEKSDDQ